jgi:glutaredoxin
VSDADEGTTMADRPTCIVYCRSWCGDCHRALQWLDEQGYEYTMIDIDQDQDARKRCVELVGKVITPTFEIGDTCVVNFDPDDLRGVLGEPRR